MPKLIDYPRTSYTGAWEVAEVVDDTGGKCALETCARKLNRKVSGSFKAIVGSAVKFGLLTSKRELLATTTLFRRIKHAYDKQEELVFHREAFLTPPLFTQLCRKFRSRELPVAMLDVLLIREFGVEEINAQSVAKAFIDGAHMVNLLDENNVIADIDQLAAQQGPRREVASPTPAANVFRQVPPPATPLDDADTTDNADEEPITDEASPRNTTDTDLTAVAGSTSGFERGNERGKILPASRPAPAATVDAIANLFGFNNPTASPQTANPVELPTPARSSATSVASSATDAPLPLATPSGAAVVSTAPTNSGVNLLFRIQLAGPGINTQLDVTELEDLGLIRALLDKIERQLRR